MPTAFPIRGQSSFVLRRAVGAKKASRPLFARVRRRRSSGRAGGRASPKVAQDLPHGSRNSCRFWRVLRLQEGGHHGGRVGPSVAHARLAAALSLLSSKKSIFLCPPSFPLSLYPTLSSLAELRLSLDMTADKGDGQRRRAILLGTFGRAEIVQCQSRKKVFSGESEEAVSRLLGCFAHAAEEDKGPSRWDDARDECECREVGGHSVRM